MEPMRRTASLLALLAFLATPTLAIAHGTDAPDVVVALWMRHEDRHTVHLDRRLAAERAARRS